MGPMPVDVVTVQQSDVPVSNEWVGTLDGFVNAQIQPQVSGYLIKQNYREGSVVQKGQVLFEIDPRPFQAALQQAEGQVGQAQGAVGQAQAQLQLAQINVNRDTPLAAEHAIAQSQLDNEKQQAAQAEASVASARASVAAAQAAVANAKLNLGFTEVRSLISGVAGQATTQVGNLVGPQSVLTSVSQLDPIKVYFSISDSEYLGLIKRTTPEQRRPPPRVLKPPAHSHARQRLCLPAHRPHHLRRPSDEPADRRHSHRCVLSQPRQYPSSRPVWPRARADHGPQ